MINKMTMPTAALRSRSESSFVVPTGAEAFWRLVDAHTGHDAYGFGAGSVHNAPRTNVTPAPMAVRDRVATKQARPPRGNPR